LTRFFRKDRRDVSTEQMLKANWVGPYEGKVSIDGARPMP
jgi:hypothetical protein